MDERRDAETMPAPAMADSDVDAVLEILLAADFVLASEDAS